MEKLLSNRKGLEMNQLYSFVLMIVLVGMIIGVGVITLDKFAGVTFYQRENTNDTIASTDWINNTAVKLSGGNLTSVDKVTNGSGTAPSNCYLVNNTEGIIYFRNVSTVCDHVESVDIIFDWKEYDTATKAATTSARVEVANISSNWLGLIVTIVVLSIILALVVRSFRPGAER